MPKNYKVISSSCYGGNKVFYSGNIFKAADVSDQDLQHLLKGGYIAETEEDVNVNIEIPVTVVDVVSEDKKILDTQLASEPDTNPAAELDANNAPAAVVPDPAQAGQETPNPADLLSDKPKNKK